MTSSISTSAMVSVIIPTYNSNPYLPICLESLRRQTFGSCQIIVVDDGSQDGSTASLQREFREVKFIRLDGNRGFSAAVNVGIRASTGELIALLNDDTEADPGWLEALVGAAERYSWAGFFASRMLEFSRRDFFDGAGDAYLRFGGACRIGRGELDEGQYAEPREILGACAGAALYRRTLFDAIGLFDEDFIAFLEDIDLSLRAQWAGLRCLYVPAACVYHVGGGSAAPGSRLSVRLAAQNRWNVAVKNIPVLLLVRSLPLMLVGECYRMVQAVRRGKGLAYWQGLASALRLLPSMLTKRHRVLGGARISAREFSTRIRRAEREAVQSLIRSGTYAPGVTKLLRWYLVL